MEIWITKHALSDGIQAGEGECEYGSTALFRSRPGNAWVYFKGHEWHRSYEEAVLEAEKMRRRKIEELEKEIDRLKKLKF